MTNFRKLIDNQTFIFTLGGLFPAVLNFIFLPIYSFILEPEDFGLFTYVMSFQGILIVLTSLSLNTFLLRKYFDINDSGTKKELFGSIFIFLSVFNLCLLFILLILFPIFLPKINSSIDYYPYFLLMIIGLFFEFFFIFPMIIYRVEKLAKLYVFYSITKQMITFILSIILISYIELGILGRFLGVLLTNIIFAIISFRILYKRIVFSYKKSIIAEGLEFSSPLIPAALLGTIYVAVDKILLINYLSLKELGLYTIAASIASVINFISLGYYKAIEPVIFESFNLNSFVQRVNNINKFLLILLIWFGTIFVLFSSEILFYFFDEKFYNAHIYIPFFVVALILNAQKRVFGTVLHAYKITKYDLPIMLLSVLSFLLLFFLLVPKYGVFGALIALIITSVLALIFTIRLVSNYLSLKNYLVISLPCLFLLIMSSYLSQDNLFFNVEYLIVTKIVILLTTSIFLYYYFKRNSELLPD